MKLSEIVIAGFVLMIVSWVIALSIVGMIEGGIDHPQYAAQCGIVPEFCEGEE